MALRDQPYLPLYVDDFLSDEKLILCSANSYGVYINIMCLMHKSETYGIILLDQKWKQNANQIINFAYKFAKILPFTYDEILSALSELTYERVLYIEGDMLIQKRMVRDNEISLVRAEAGFKGGKQTQFAKANKEANNEANSEANTVIVNENVIDNNIEIGIEKDFVDKVIDVFAIEYESMNQIKYVQISKGKERSAAGKILKLHKEHHPEMTTEETLKSLQIYFRVCVAINDEWLRNNMSLSIIVSKFNEINNKLRNGKTKRVNGTGATDEELRELLAGKFATDKPI
jgi:hypothetical protein